MTLTRCIEILTAHNAWRRGIEPYDEMGVLPPHTPKEIDSAIDSAIAIMQAQEKLIIKLREKNHATANNSTDTGKRQKQ